MASSFMRRWHTPPRGFQEQPDGHQQNKNPGSRETGKTGGKDDQGEQQRGQARPLQQGWPVAGHQQNRIAAERL